MHFFESLIYITFLAIVILLLLTKVKAPAILAFLLTGIIAGPSAASLLHTTEEIEILAEMGVMLLMFNIGLEFSLGSIKKMKYEVLVLGGLQVCITIILAFMIQRLFKLTTPECLVGGFVISLSSTAIVLKQLIDHTELQTPHGRIMVGILIFQDLCIVPMLLLLPVVGQSASFSILDITYQVGKSFLLIAAIFVIAKYILPKVFDFVVGFRVKEGFLILLLGLCFGLALLTNNLGFSYALGSFLAGMILAESDYIRQVEADIKPIRIVFISLFFVSVGMFLDVSYLLSNWQIIMVGLLSLVVLKALVTFLILTIAKYPLNVGIITALSIAQIGEFSFLILNISKGKELISAEYYQYLLTITVLSMLSTPLLIWAGNFIGKKDAMKKQMHSKHHFEAQTRELFNHVIIAGFGVNGLNLSKMFRALDIHYRILEMNPHTVKKHKALGEDIVFGDITQADNLKHLGAEKASLMIIAISDPHATLTAVELTRRLNPSIHIIVRSEFISQIEAIYNKGANLVISQDLEAAIEISTYVLKYYGFSSRIINYQNDIFRKDHYGFFFSKNKNLGIDIAEFIGVEKIDELFLITRESRLIGKVKKEIDFNSTSFGYLDVSIIGLVRDGKVINKLPQDLEFKLFDSLIIHGEQRKIEQAKEYLNNFTS